MTTCGRTSWGTSKLSVPVEDEEERREIQRRLACQSLSELNQVSPHVSPSQQHANFDLADELLRLHHSRLGLHISWPGKGKVL